VTRHFRDRHSETWWATDLTFSGYGPDRSVRLVVATTDPATLPAISTRYMATNLPRPGSRRARTSPHRPADLAEIVRLYPLRNWVEQGYKQVKHELGWADFMVRSDRAIRRHWQLVCCAFSVCWRAWFADEGEAIERPHSVPTTHAETSARVTPALWPALRPAGGNEDQFQSTAAPRSVTWPVTLRRVRAWLDRWTFLWRWWRSCSTAPPPKEIQALLYAVETGLPLRTYVPK
jgi:hypothetical protein